MVSSTQDALGEIQRMRDELDKAEAALKNGDDFSRAKQCINKVETACHKMWMGLSQLEFNS